MFFRSPISAYDPVEWGSGTVKLLKSPYEGENECTVSCLVLADLQWFSFKNIQKYICFLLLSHFSSTSLTPPLFIDNPVGSQKSEHSCLLYFSYIFLYKFYCNKNTISIVSFNLSEKYYSPVNSTNDYSLAGE